MKTADGVKVKAGDKVWVIGSFGPTETTVKKPEPTTNYMYYSELVPVKRSYSSKDAALKAMEAVKAKPKKGKK